MSLIALANRYHEKLVLPRVPIDADEARRRKLFVTFVLIISVALVIFGVQHLVNTRYLYGTIDLLAALICIVIIAVLKYLRNGRPFYRLAIIMFESLLIYWLITGAIEGYASLWILAIPLFTFYLFGLKEGIFWSLFMWIFSAAVFINPLGLPFLFHYPSDFFARHLFLFGFLFLFTYYYESAREAYRIAMETERKNLQFEKELLGIAKKETESANLLLREEMTERKRAEKALMQYQNNLEELIRERTLELEKKNAELIASEKRYRLLAENTSDMIWSTDLDFHLTYISPSVERMFGYTVEEAMVLPIDKWNTPESLRKLMDLYDLHVKNDAAWSDDLQRHASVQLEQYKKNGDIINVEITISFILGTDNRPAGFIGISRDIDERIRNQRESEKMQLQLAQAQKLEAIGTLVGGIAHDFNNFLGAIMGSMELLESSLRDEHLNNRETIEHFLQTGLNASKRSTDLIKQLLAISRKHEIFLKPVDINDSLNHILELCKNSFPKSIELDFRLAPAPLMIMGDQVQVDQVLLNICINASHAMTIMRAPGEKQGGTLTVQADIVDAEHEQNGDLAGGTIPAAWVRVRISDTGIGMSEEIQKRAFEPFFSTKSKNREWSGSGLGLSTSYNIVQKHGGRITVHSVPGRGTSFSIYFPASRQCGGDRIPAAKAEELARGTGTVLVIDDEQMIVNIVKGILQRCGYRVLSGTGAREGISVFREHHAVIDGIIIDYNMPDKSGLDVFREIRAIDPGAKAILSSGMIDNEIKTAAIDLGIRDIINKPFLAQELSVKIRDLLSRP